MKSQAAVRQGTYRHIGALVRYGARSMLEKTGCPSQAIDIVTWPQQYRAQIVLFDTKRKLAITRRFTKNNINSILYCSAIVFCCVIHSSCLPVSPIPNLDLTHK